MRTIKHLLQKRAVKIIVSIITILVVGYYILVVKNPNQGFVVEVGVLVKYKGPGGTVTIPAEVTKIENDAFTKAKIETIKIHKDVVEIEPYAFSGCDKLRAVKVDTDNAIYLSYDDSLYQKDQDGTLTPLLITKAKSGRLTIPEGVIEINKEEEPYGNTNLFFDLQSITSIHFPSSLIFIGKGWLTYCPALEKITVSENNPVFVSYDGILIQREDNGLLSIRNLPEKFSGEWLIPEGVTEAYLSIPFSANVTRVFIPSTFVEITRGSCFRHAKQLTNIEVDKNNPIYFSDNGILYKKEDDGSITLIKCPEGKTGKIAVFDGTTLIGRYSFSNVTGMTKIILPDSVKEIDSMAFDHCTKLEKVYFQRI